MSTETVVKLFQKIRERILTFEHPDGYQVLDTLGSVATGRIYYGAAPENVTTPYVVGRLVNQQKSMGGVRLRADLELMVFDRPRARQAAAENLADYIEGALIGYRGGPADFLLTNPPQRDSLEPVPHPGDAALVQIRLFAEILAFPEYLTQYAVPANS